MHVRFTGAFDWTPPEDRRITIERREGWSGSVRTDHGRAAIRAGKAVKLPTPRRKATA